MTSDERGGEEGGRGGKGKAGPSLRCLLAYGSEEGFIVDSVSEVLKIPRNAIGPTPVLSEEQARIISRVANLEKQKRMILLIDVDHLLEKHEITTLEEASGIKKQRAPADEPSPALCLSS